MKKKFIIPALIILVLLSLFFLPGKKKEKQVKTFKLSYSSLKVNTRASGLVSPTNRLEIKPPVAGRIEKVLIEEGKFVNKGSILAWMSSTERAALLDAARARGKGEMKEWEDMYRPTPVIAPLKGMIIANNIKSGQMVTQQDVLLVLSDALIIKAKVDETDIARIKNGQKASITIDSFPEEKISSRVKHIAFEAVTENSVTTYEVLIEPEQRPDFLRSGMSATVDFVLLEREKTLMVPENAVYENKKGEKFVLKLNPSSKSKKKMDKVFVKTGYAHESSVEIIEGLQEGDEIVIKEKKKSKKDKEKNPFVPSFFKKRR